MGKKYLFSFLFILAIALVFSAHSYNDDYFLKETYAIGDEIYGWVNISFDAEPSDSKFTDNNGGEITLKEALQNSGYFYDCPNNCENIYSSAGSLSSQNLNLAEDQEEVIGIEFFGNVLGINSIEFNVSSDVGESGSNQIEIDFFNDMEVDWRNTNSGSVDSNRDYGCFLPTESTMDVDLRQTPYCQRVVLGESSGFEVGAWITESSSGAATITMDLYSKDGYSIGSCNLNKTGFNGDEYLFCSIDEVTKEASEYYVCVSSDETGGTYKTKRIAPTYTGESCGFWGTPNPLREETTSYYIGVNERDFGAFGEIKIDDPFLDRGELKTLIYTYLLDNYNEGDCTSGCYVPIRVLANEAQNVVFDSLTVSYDEKDGAGITTNKFHSLEKIARNVDSSFQKFQLSNLGFEVPGEEGLKNYKLYFNGDELISQDINIKKVDISLSPTKGIQAFPITYEVTTSAVASKYEWDFGDGTGPQITSSNEQIHTYSSTGNYTIAVTVIDSMDQRFTHSFDIVVESPDKMISHTINYLDNQLEFLENQLSTLTSFERKEVEKALGIAEVKNSLSQAKSIQTTPSRESEAISLLLPLDIPVLIISYSLNVPFFLDQRTLNPNFLSQVTGYNDQIDDSTKNIIAGWEVENLGITVSKSDFSKDYGEGAKQLVSVFKVGVREKKFVEEDYYLIVHDMENLELPDEFTKAEGYSYVKVSGDGSYSFSTTEDLEIYELPIYFTPDLNSLPVLQFNPEEFQSKFLVTIVLFFIGLVLLSLVVYLALQRWYKIKYERFLFKDRNYLFNMITYVKHAKRKGLSPKKIEKNLRKVGWTREQIRYVMKRYEGKNTGMYELPVNKLLKRKDKELEDKIRGPRKNPMMNHKNINKQNNIRNRYGNKNI